MRGGMGVALATTSLWLASAMAAAAEEVTFKAISAFAEKTFYSRGFERFIDKVNADGKGQVQISYVGGPKAMPPFEVGNALKGGVVDLANVTGAFYTNVMPEADAWKLAEKPMAELRKNGGYAYMAALSDQTDLGPRPHRTEAAHHPGLPRFLPDARGYRRADRAWRGLYRARARRGRRLRLADHRHLRSRLA